MRQIYETTRDLASQHELPMLLETIVQRANMLLATPSSALFLFDPARGDLELSLSTGFILPMGTRLPLGEGIAGRVAQTRQPLVVDDYRTWDHRSSIFTETPITSAMQVPMVYAGELIGVLAVNELEPMTRHFTEAHVHLLSLFASQAAGAVHNARLFQETQTRAEELALLYDVGLILNRTLDPRQQMQSLFSSAMNVLHAERAQFFRMDEAQGVTRFEFGVGQDVKTQVALERLSFSVNEERGLHGWIAKHRAPLNLPDVSADPRWVAVDPEIRSGL
jgi:GAF domain-containing protein